MNTVLYYIHDPMCSWCWAHRPVWDALQSALPPSVSVEYILGGLAPDTDQPMPEAQRRTIEGYWRQISTRLGTAFNFNFWTENTPRRSTYPACRAVIAAGYQGCGQPMINAIQCAYYQRALNPSDSDVLLRLAWELFSQELDLDVDRFARELDAEVTQRELARQAAFARVLSAQGFPSMVLEHQGTRHPVVRDYSNYRTSLAQITEVMSE